ncbi:MAG: DUF58 domain-containing protein [Planctomycetota bacterium]|nr:DUF58 domain-containing protein [Planctomycetota bacterium]
MSQSKRMLPVRPPIIFILLLFLVGPAALLQGNNPLLWMLCVLIVIGLSALLLSRVVLRQIIVRRILPDHGVVGEPLVVGYEFSRRARRLASFDITITERFHDTTLSDSCPAWILHAGPRQTVHGEGLFVPASRGRMAFCDMEIRTGFPMGITPCRRIFRMSQDLRIHPAIVRLKSNLVQSIVGAGGEGRRSVDRHGSGLDYFGTRAARTGDGWRDIAWKISARRNTLVAIERARPASPRLRVVLDLTVPTDQLQVSADETFTASELEERAISLAASILRDASSRGYDTGLTIQGLSAPPHPLRAGLRHISRMLGTLADLDLQQPRQPWEPVPERERSGLVVIHPDRVRQPLKRSNAWHLTGRQLDELSESSSQPADKPVSTETAA